MDAIESLRYEINEYVFESEDVRAYHIAKGLSRYASEPIPIARARGIESLFLGHRKHVYEYDQVVGSIAGTRQDTLDKEAAAYANMWVKSFGNNTFLTNADHFAPDYETVCAIGVQGLIQKIESSIINTTRDAQYQKKVNFLEAAKITMVAFASMIEQYATAARLRAKTARSESSKRLEEAASVCDAIATGAPSTFYEALQLIWLIHTAFCYEGRYAMALGRLDQILYPFYIKDVQAERMDSDRAEQLLASTLIKIGERRKTGGDDVVNICIGGKKPDGSDAVNELSFIILQAVNRCHIPGPNLSARIDDTKDHAFLDECLKVIGTGLGYPALMNDKVNIRALLRHGYAPEDCNNYAMVGCIENFLPGKQPPWSDGRFNVPKYLELALARGVCMKTNVRMGPKTQSVSDMDNMDAFMHAFMTQIEHGAAQYMALFQNENDRYNKVAYTQPFLSCFCQDCIARGLDINDGGSVYPSVHGAALMGIATVADSLAAIEAVVFRDQKIDLPTLVSALRCNFKGYETIRSALLSAPKYGNNDDFVDRWAVWYVEYLERVFSKYRTRDGGAIYTAIASNTQNISAGELVWATPDGRLAGKPLSDAASPMYGCDWNGPTAVVLSVSKPDYTKTACGTVLNQKFSPAVFETEEKRRKLAALIRTYFARGGQEIQINAVSRETMKDAMENPAQYASLVVRVSGFSAYYTGLPAKVQLDILNRTEHGS